MKFTVRAFGALTLAAMLMLGAAACKDKKTGGNGGGVVSGDTSPVWIVVNGQNITQAAIERGIKYVTKELDPQMAMEKAGEIKRFVMEAEVRMAVLDEVVAKEGLTLPPGELDKQIEQVKSNFQPPTEYDTWIKEVWGDEAAFKKVVERNLLHRSLIEKKATPADPTEEEIQKRYQEIIPMITEPAQAKVQHIQISIPPAATPEQKAEKKKAADEIKAKLDKGGDFTALVKEYSDAASKANDGNDTFTKGQRLPEFDSAVFGLAPGQVSPVLEDGMGFHLVKLIEIVPEKAKPLEEIKDYLVQQMKEESKSKVVEAYIAGLVAAAKIEYKEPLPPEPAPEPEFTPPTPEMEPGSTAAAPAPAPEPGATSAAPAPAPESAPVPVAPAPETAPAPVPEAAPAPGGAAQP